MKATVIKLSDSARSLFEKMHFPEIPTEANFIAFTEDGDAIFLSELDMQQFVSFPKFVSLNYYDVDNLGIE